jgi:hypothetical protein
MAVSLLFTGFTRHPKILRAGEPAAWLFVCMLEYCAENRTDGFVADFALDGFALKNIKGRLAKLTYADERHGPLLHRMNGGYQINDYLEWNRRAADLAQKEREKSAARAAAGRKGAQSRWGNKLDSKPDGKPIANDMATGSQTDGSGPGPGPLVVGIEGPSSAVDRREPLATADLSDLQKQEIDKLAANLHALRPGIDRTQVEFHLTRLVVLGKQSWPHIAAAMIACVLDPETRLANRISLATGYWWNLADSRTQRALGRWMQAGHSNPAKAVAA